ncbi:hypothetical protein LTR53_002865 [Teratosphaeriaceae sp. CCFEE 6253]|nr:hypothetical protein LTR53_002865 [Teratosphaeriaceae sp. CCFEE 6253]
MPFLRHPLDLRLHPLFTIVFFADMIFIALCFPPFGVLETRNVVARFFAPIRVLLLAWDLSLAFALNVPPIARWMEEDGLNLRNFGMARWTTRTCSQCAFMFTFAQ